MSHEFRFLAERSQGGQWTMPIEEWHHLDKVLRLPVGAEFELANGKGWVASASLVSLNKHGGDFEVVEQFYSPKAPSAFQFALAIGALRPQSVDELLPYIIELGVDAIEIFSFQGMDKNRLQEKVLDRWNRILAASMKQCKRAWAPEISWSPSFEALIQKSENWPNRIYLDPHGDESLARWSPAHFGPTIAVIGSEKGLDKAEIQRLKDCEFLSCRIEGSILRATTAAIAAAVLLKQSLQPISAEES